MNSPQELEDEYGAHAFQKFPLCISRGKGALVWDQEGKEYVDFHSGYGVALVGHSNGEVVRAVSDQASKVITCHGSFYNEARSLFLEKLVKVAPRGLSKAILTNSGTESVEAAIKLARRRTRRKKVVSMKGGFHGKTYGSLSATWNKKYRDPFGPLLDGFDFAEFGDSQSLAALVDSDTAAVIVEPIQGESGIVVPPDGYLKEAREVCDSRGALLIFDEIQTGLGRTGRMWASEHWGVSPDIMTVSKGLGGGVPVGAALGGEDTMSSLKGGEHTSTFAGNPLSCAAGLAALEYITKNDLPGRAAVVGKSAREGLEKLAASHKLIKEVRGMGLMLAAQARVDIHQPLLTALEKGAIFAYSGRDTFRLLPPLVIEDSQIARGLGALEGAIVEEESKRL